MAQVSRITLNYEKFLLDSEGSIMRRYPRQWPALRMENDIQVPPRFLMSEVPLYTAGVACSAHGE